MSEATWGKDSVALWIHTLNKSDVSEVLWDCDIIRADDEPDVRDSLEDQFFVFMLALTVNANRERKYRGLWRKYGYKGVMTHVASKAARAQVAVDRGTLPQDLDDALDILNYAGFLIRLAVDGDRDGEKNEEEVDWSVTVAKVKERADKDPVWRAGLLEALGVNGGVVR